MTFLSLNGEDFHVRVEGPDDAPVLMMSNSLATDLTMWDAQAAALKDRYRIVRYDSRGAGKSVAPNRPYSMTELARDALNILDALKIERAHWLGLSKGGMVGQWLAAHHGDRLGKVILANTAARMNAPGLWNQRIRTVRTGGMAAIVDATVARWLTPGCIAASPDLVARIRAMILATPPMAMPAAARPSATWTSTRASRRSAIPSSSSSARTIPRRRPPPESTSPAAFPARGSSRSMPRICRISKSPRPSPGR